MEFENDSVFEKQSFFPSLYDSSFSNPQMLLEKIDSNLFNEDNKSFHLDKFFEPRQSAFVEKESHRFSQSFTAQYRHYQMKFSDTVMSDVEKATKIPSFRRVCSVLVSQNFDKFYDGMFATKQGASVEEFVNNMYHKSIELCLSQVSVLTECLYEMITQRTPSDREKSNGSAKKIPWTPPEEKELFEIVKQSYPMSVAGDQLNCFCEKFSRTRSGVLNKIHKIKRKFEGEFRQRNADIFSEFMEGGTKGGLEQSVLNVIQSENQTTYEYILSRLKIDSSQIEERGLVNEILYDLLNNNRIRCDEKLFIELVDSTGFCLSQSPSPIIKKVVEIVGRKKDQSMVLEDLRDVLVHEFQIVDKKGEELDAHLMDFLQKSKLILMKKKRVFY